jgi:hypothetical protein
MSDLFADFFAACSNYFFHSRILELSELSGVYFFEFSLTSTAWTSQVFG